MLNSYSNSGADDVFHAAKFYSSLNYGVIPVYGNRQPERPKVAAVDWKAYQFRRAGDADFQRWFIQAGFDGLAIVTGTISRLVVLDFDDDRLAADFARTHPHLTETRTVRSATRGTPHYYFALPAGMHVASRKTAGIDLLSDGRYVVAPPTKIGDSEYRVMRGGQPRLLNQVDIVLIEQFVDNCAAPVKPVAETVDSVPVAIAESTIFRRHVDAETLIALYRQFAPHTGRNEALFRQALYARDCGLSIDETMRVMVDIHVHEPATRQHILETPAQRRHEAIATIESAYSRPPAKNLSEADKSSGLPGTLREKFLKNQDMALLRVLDGLLINGVQAGVILSEKSVSDVLKNQVGRHSILKALQSTMPDGQPVFGRVDPSPGTPTRTDVATSVTLFPEQKMLFVGVTEPDKKRGRPAAQYRMPDMARLCAAWDVRYVPGDALQQDDLRTVKTYRLGVHRELLKRRPGLYARTWLATRLGVTVRSLQRYRAGADVQVSPVYREVPITWQTMAYIPVGVPAKGVFLEDDTGKRYPPLPEIARKLLKQKKKIRCLFQCENHYSVRETPQTAIAVPQTETEASRFQAMWAKIGALYTGAPKIAAAELPLIASKPQVEPVARITLPIAATISRRYIPQAKRYYRQPMPQPAHEETANHLYSSLKNLCAKASGYLSLPTARRLVEEYGGAMVKKALQVVKSRTSIATPAGFVISWLRSEVKSWQNQYSNGVLCMENSL